MGIQALPLIIWPSSIASLLREDQAHVSSLEEYLARSLGFALLALGLVVVLLSGAVPLGSEVDVPKSGISPYANAVLIVATLHHAPASIYCYWRYNGTGQMGFLLGSLGSGFFAAGALYCVMFAGDQAMISKHHRFDQSTSGFPFSNSTSYRAKKKAL
ncbi:hypothetical protein GMORB2_5725 [Geosmithia morbida]|uniref:Uncharacterized protein n=1 Tax=Geosmithia morbida TaxID=1094350 RepID=A0A9P5D6Z1_9HYPO|nr:uncharacterized protein GMORB2_5725 [Geosmithia morbida]KAF4124009.1 hypothetical protein GMORB2_5725 [Geosmithia morbida]